MHTSLVITPPLITVRHISEKRLLLHCNPAVGSRSMIAEKYMLNLWALNPDIGGMMTMPGLYICTCLFRSG